MESYESYEMEPGLTVQNITNVLHKQFASERLISVEYAGVNKYASRQF